LVVVAAERSGVIQRQRKLTAPSIARGFILGFVQDPNASDELLAQQVAACGTPVTPQAIEQRHTPRLVAFLKALFVEATRSVVGVGGEALAPILARFTAVALVDSTTVTLPDGQRDDYPGCGGGRGQGGGRAGLKLQVELDLKTGALSGLDVEPAKRPDQSCGRQSAAPVPGSLRISDLGYFCLGVFAALAAGGAYFLSRLQCGVAVHRPDGTPLDLLSWLTAQRRGRIDAEVQLGATDRVPSRLLAWRVPRAVADQRRRRLRANCQRRKSQPPSKERLAWCDWTVLVTNCPATLLAADEADVLYRARWQIELLFKRWKSQGLIADLRGATEDRQMVRVWARLCAALLLHWLTVAVVAGRPTISFDKAVKLVRRYAQRLLTALDHVEALTTLIEQLAGVLQTTCRRNRRKHPGTFELLNQFPQPLVLT
jgi:hypothetical protein